MGAPALEVGEVRAILSLDTSGFTQGLSGAFGSIGQIASRYGPEAAALAGVVLATALTTAFALKVGEGIKTALEQSFDTAKDYEMSTVYFDFKLGKDWPALESELLNFASATPFSSSKTIEFAKNLHAVGFAAGDLIPMMTDIGDAVGALGTGEEGMQRIVRAFMDMRSAGKLNARDMLQLTMANVNGWQFLSDALGVSQGEVRKMVEQGLIPAEEGIAMIRDGMQEAFGGQMSAQMETTYGQFENLSDATWNLKRTIGEMLLPAAKELLPILADGIRDITDKVSAFSEKWGPQFAAFWDEFGPTIQWFVNGELTNLKDTLMIVLEVMRFIMQSATGISIGFGMIGDAAARGITVVKDILERNLIEPLNRAIRALNTILDTRIPTISMGERGGGGSFAVNRGGGRGFAEGGIATGPTSGYLALLHGTELITPWDKVGQTGPTINIYGSRADASIIASEVRKVLRGEVGGALSRAALMGA